MQKEDRQILQKVISCVYRKRGVMRVSAVGFLFQNNLKKQGIRGNNYTCIIHKVTPDGNYTKNVVSSPIIKQNTMKVVSPEIASLEVRKYLASVADNKSSDKFIGATIKDGIKETEIHSFLTDGLFAVRTKDEYGKDHFRIQGKKGVQKTLARNLSITA